MLNFLAVWHNERLAVRELSRLSDHRLADLGVARSEIKAVARSAALMARSQAVERAAVQRVTGAVEDMAPSWAHHNRRAIAA